MLALFTERATLLLAVDEPGFRAFTPQHYWTVAICVLLMAAYAWLGCHWRLRWPAAEVILRRTLAWFNLGVYVTYLAWLWQPRNFVWERSLPLEFCDMGMLVAAAVLLWRTAWLRGLLYFWATVFTLQAFLTPILQQGPATIDFWLFWGAHVGIIGAAIYDVAVLKFRPTLRYAVRCYLISISYGVVMLILDVLTGWDYGFVGPGKPATPTLIDALGAFPLRLIWMMLLAALGFTLAWLPWAWKAKRA